MSPCRSGSPSGSVKQNETKWFGSSRDSRTRRLSPAAFRPAIVLANVHAQDGIELIIGQALQEFHKADQIGGNDRRGVGMGTEFDQSGGRFAADLLVVRARQRAKDREPLVAGLGREFEPSVGKRLVPERAIPST